MGFAMMMLQPPWIFIIGGLLLLGLTICLCTTFWDTFKPGVYALLDALAVVVRFLLAVVEGIKWVVKNSARPIKEFVFRRIDAVYEWKYPQKAKTAKAPVNVPVFYSGARPSSTMGTSLPMR
mmetsp:Transcript_61380/g.96866  ORF Transcript_61380/g.96866 Transcript_61380/m.96866 type:complete len:122 (-) Transcript_61380:43-408(-)